MTVAGAVKDRTSIISFESWRFVIFDAPRDSNLADYRDELVAAGVKHVVRACEPTYSADLLAPIIYVHELNFDDGASPDGRLLEKWRSTLHLVEKEAIATASPGAEPIKVVGVHCVAGLGRSPTLVAIALMDRGMSCADAVDAIRSKRRGAINSKQLDFLFRYKPVKRSGSFVSAFKALLGKKKK